MYALLRSQDEGTYLVKGDSAVWMSPLSYGSLTSTTEGLRIVAPSPNSRLLWPDSMVSASGLRLEAVPSTARRPLITHTTGGVVVGATDDLLLERANLSGGQFGGRSWASVLVKRDLTGIEKASDDAMFNRSCAEASVDINPLEVESAIWTVGEHQMVSVIRVPSFDREYLNRPVRPVGKSVLITLLSFDSESLQTFSEIIGDPVSIVSLGAEFALVTTRELLLFDSLGHERSHAYLPHDFVPKSATSFSDSSGDFIWIIDEGVNGRGRINKVNSSFELLGSYASVVLDDKLQKFALRSVSGTLSLAATTEFGYRWFSFQPSSLPGNGMQWSSSPSPILPKVEYPLPDTLELIQFGRGFLINDCDLIGDFDTVYVLRDSSIWIDGPLFNELRGRSEQWLANWTPTLDPNPIIQLDQGNFETDNDGIRFSDANGDVRLFQNGQYSRFESLGEVSPGYALYQYEDLGDAPFGDYLELRIADSPGRSYTYLLYSLARETITTTPDAGLLANYEVLTSTPSDFDREIQINFIPWEVLRLPENLPAHGCAGTNTGTSELFWSGMPNQPGTFTFNGTGRQTGRVAGLSFSFYLESSFILDSILSSFSMIYPCGDLVPGRLEVEISSAFPHVTSFINGEAATILDSIESRDLVNLELIDSVSGCEIDKLIIALPRSFSYFQSDPCFGRLGNISSNSGDTSFFDFPDSTYIGRRRNIEPGVYPMTFRTSEGCSIDTMLVILEAPEIVLSVDSTIFNGLYDLEASVTDTLYNYTFSWSGGTQGTTATYPPGTEVNLSTVQIGGHSRCSNSLRFTLGGVSNVGGAHLEKLNVSVDANGNLLVNGLEEYAQAQGVPLSDITCKVLDAAGRHLYSYQAFGDLMKIERNSGHTVGPKFLSFGKLGGIGIIW